MSTWAECNHKHIFNYTSKAKKYANEKDRSLWREFIAYQMELQKKHGVKGKSPFVDKGIYERHS